MNPIALLTGVPVWVWGLAGALAWGAAGHWKASSAAQRLADERRAQAIAYTKGLEKVHEEHAAALAARERAIQDGSKQLEAARTRGAADRAVVGELRDLSAAAVRAAAAGAGTVAASEAIRELGEAARQCFGRLEEVAGLAREGLAAHRQCAAEYRAMTAPRSP